MRTLWEPAAIAILMLVVTVSVGSVARAQGTARPDAWEGKQVIRLTPEELTWTAGPPMLPVGARMAVIEGSFNKPGPFTVRLKFPANYKIPAHWHPTKVIVTVISGTFNMGLGDTLDTSKGKTLPAGSIFEMPATIHHFGLDERRDDHSRARHRALERALPAFGRLQIAGGGARRGAELPRLKNFSMASGAITALGPVTDRFDVVQHVPAPPP